MNPILVVLALFAVASFIVCLVLASTGGQPAAVRVQVRQDPHLAKLAAEAQAKRPSLINPSSLVPRPNYGSRNGISDINKNA